MDNNQILDYLDNNKRLRELIEDVVKDSFRYMNDLLNFEGDTFILQGKVIDKNFLIEFLKSLDPNKTLSDEEFQLILNSVIDCIYYRIYIRNKANKRALACCSLPEYRSSYGSENDAYWHLFEKFLDDNNYWNRLSNFFIDNCKKISQHK